MLYRSFIRLNPFVLTEDKKQKEKSDLFTAILNTGKNLLGARIKANIAKMKSLKRQSIKMLKRFRRGICQNLRCLKN